GDAIAGLENQPGLERDVVDEGSVLTAEILNGPIVALRLKGEVLARETGILGKTQFGGTRAAHGEALARQWNGLHLPVGTLNAQFTRHVWSIIAGRPGFGVWLWPVLEHDYGTSSR